MTCPAVNGALSCGREDTWAGHLCLLHRDFKAGREWRIDSQDRARWGLTPTGRVKKSHKDNDPAEALCEETADPTE